jgi:hypothetical protein
MFSVFSDPFSRFRQPTSFEEGVMPERVMHSVFQRIDIEL